MKEYDIEVERSVIGCFLIYDEPKKKIPLLSEDDFYFPNHKKIIKKINLLYSSGNSTDAITVGTALENNERNEITACVQCVISVAYFDEHFALLKSMASSRRIINRFNRLISEEECDIHTVQKIVDDEMDNRLTNDIEKINKHNINLFLSGLNQKKDQIQTGFFILDGVLSGLRKGTVFILGARPSTGKTTFALNIATNQLPMNKKTMFFSLEMSAEMIFERIESAKNEIRYSNFSNNCLRTDEVDLIEKDMKEMSQSEMFSVFDDVYNAELISNLIVDNKPDFVVIDYMQIITTSNKFENVRTKIDYISSLFKRTAKNTGCTIMILSQLTRAGKEAPTMSDLKESGGLEQDGDYIALLHRPYVSNKSDGDFAPEQTELIVDKNKFGRTGKINFHFDLKYQKFYELDKNYKRVDSSYVSPEDDEIEI